MTDLLEALRVLPGAGRLSDAPYGLLRLRGPDAGDFLQRLCSQDVAALTDGAVAPAAFLDPKGKLLATAWIGRTAGHFLVSTQAGTLDRLAETLERYHFTEQLEIERPAGLVCIAVRGPDALAAVGAQDRLLLESSGGVQMAVAGRHGVHLVRWHGPAEAAAGFAGDLPADDAAGAGLWRLAGGEALVGVDTEATTLAMEVDLDDHISTTKGCYTGQEIVARIHTYGHVNRRLVRLHVATSEPIEAKTSLCEADEGDPVGRVMSSAPLPDGAGSLALGFLPEAFLDDPEPLTLGTAEGPAVQVVDDSFEPA